MKTRPGLLIQIIVSVLMWFPLTTSSDQTDSRLDALFSVLQSSEQMAELEEAEKTIWEIWYDSGDQEIDVLMTQAAAAVEVGRLDYAENLYSQVTNKVPKFSEGWNRRATVRYYMEDYAGSLNDIQRTLVLEPRHFGATWGLGMILGHQRKFGAAITAFERLLELKPNSREARLRIEMLKQALSESAV